MKKPLAVQFEFDMKTIRRALALITGEAMTDEEIIAKFIDREPVKADTEAILENDMEAFQICAWFIAVIAADGKPYLPQQTTRSARHEAINQKLNPNQ